MQKSLETYKAKDKIDVSTDELPKEEVVVVKDYKDMTPDEQEEFDNAEAIHKAYQASLDNGTAPAARGTPWMPSATQANLVMMYGCQPSRFVLAETRMLYDLFDSLNSRFNPQTLSLELPKMFDDLQSDSEDAMWEIWRSNQIQTVRLFYEKNRVTQREGYIFYTDHVNNKH